MKKVKKDGKVAVLYSPGYGAGWATWNGRKKEEIEALIFDEKLVALVANGNNEMITSEFIKENYGIDAYCGGAEDLKIEWIDEGVQFDIEEYDGFESIRIIGDRSYYTA